MEDGLIGSGSRSKAGFDISGVETSSSAAGNLVFHLRHTELKRTQFMVIHIIILYRTYCVIRCACSCKLNLFHCLVSSSR
jgi:hypothetical protein